MDKRILTFKNESYIEKYKEIECVNIDGDVAMMNIKMGKYYVLNEVASDIWNFIESKRKLSEIIEYLRNIYDVDYEVCKNETINCLEILQKNNLVKVS
ncbi:MAG: PqqD family peptide modification chaperone [Sarcina sp.]